MPSQDENSTHSSDLEACASSCNTCGSICACVCVIIIIIIICNVWASCRNLQADRSADQKQGCVLVWGVRLLVPWVVEVLIL